MAQATREASGSQRWYVPCACQTTPQLTVRSLSGAALRAQALGNSSEAGADEANGEGEEDAAAMEE